MPGDPRSPDPTSTAAGIDECYVEHLRVPLRWWAIATMFWASVLLAFLVAVPVWVALLVPGSLAALTAAIFVTYGSAEVSILRGTFRAGRAEVPVHLLAEPLALTGAEARRAAGVDADARAYLLIRPYIATAVRVRLVDPADPTPYWLVSTRHPTALAAALREAIDRAVR